jgi:hypothetical protein
MSLSLRLFLSKPLKRPPALIAQWALVATIQASFSHFCMKLFLAACHTDLEKQFSDFLDGADDVLRFMKNERFGFSVTYHESNRPRQYYPDFIVETTGEWTCSNMARRDEGRNADEYPP